MIRVRGDSANFNGTERELTLIEHLEISKALARFYGRNIGKKYFDKHVEVVI